MVYAKCDILARARIIFRAQLRRSTILSDLGPDHTLTVLFLGTHTRTSQWVTHPGNALARTRLTSEFRWNPKLVSSQNASCLTRPDPDVLGDTGMVTCWLTPEGYESHLFYAITENMLKSIQNRTNRPKRDE